jgi:hypothetical protein
VAAALGAGGRLILPIEAVLRDVSALQQGQTQDLPQLIADSQASLSSFRDRQTKTYDASLRLAALYRLISEGFRKLIVSVQSHDITRQQVEHVIEALRLFCAESQPAPLDGDGSADSGRSTVALALQSMQLADAGRTFAVSVAAILGSLDDIATHVLQMADESRTLSTVFDDERDSFFFDMEQGCTTMAAGLSQCGTAQSAIQAAGGSLVATIGRMRGPLEEIRSIEAQMRRMAMNARISAFHLGASGHVLGVLAGLVQELATECGGRSTLLATTLGSMSRVVAHLSATSEATTAIEKGTDAVHAGEMREAVAAMHASRQQSAAQITRIVERGANLREQLLAAQAGFGVGALFADTVTRVRNTLDAIVDQQRAGMSRDRLDASERELTALAARYTMQAERDVHEGMIGARVAEPPVFTREAPADAIPGASDPFGENVEFF